MVSGSVAKHRRVVFCAGASGVGQGCRHSPSKVAPTAPREPAAAAASAQPASEGSQIDRLSDVTRACRNIVLWVVGHGALFFQVVSSGEEGGGASGEGGEEGEERGGFDNTQRTEGGVGGKVGRGSFHWIVSTRGPT